MLLIKRSFIAVFLVAMGLTGPAYAQRPPARAVATVIYVDAHAAGPTYDGTSWANAYTSLQAGLNAATSGDEVWVAQGIYTPTQGLTRTATFALESGVALYGGFAATETLHSQRDWSAHVTVLSGDLDGDDAGDANGVVTATANITGSNAYNVVTAFGLVSNARLDGFTITAGSADGGDFPQDAGGGLVNQSGNILTLEHVIFSGNRASHGGGLYNASGNDLSLDSVTFNNNQATSGGGFYNSSGNALTLTSAAFNGNEASIYGGGLYNASGNNLNLNNTSFSGNHAAYGGGLYNQYNTNTTLDGVAFSANSADWGGGGLANFGNPSLSHCIFGGNSAAWGGGMYNYQAASPFLSNVTFHGNAASNGGGIYNHASSPNIVNATLSGNDAYTTEELTGYGGGIFNDGSSNPQLVNSILWDDGAGTAGPEIYNMDGGSTVGITYSDVQWPSGVYTGTGNIKINPLFVVPVAPNAAPTASGNYRLQATSLAIDAGQNLMVTTPTDLDRRTRIIGSAVDMGAYEFGLRLYAPVVVRDGP